jgi:hypothetical protein
MGLGAAWLWSLVKDRKNAFFAIDQASWVAVSFACVGWGIRDKSRTAALGGFVLFLVPGGYWFATGRSYAVIALIAGLALLGGRRGTCSYRRLAPMPPEMPGVEESLQAVGAETRPTGNGS